MAKAKPEVYKGEVFRDTVSMTLEEIRAGKLSDADAVCEFIETVFNKLCTIRAEATPYDEYEKYNR